MATYVDVLGCCSRDGADTEAVAVVEQGVQEGGRVDGQVALVVAVFGTDANVEDCDGGEGRVGMRRRR